MEGLLGRRVCRPFDQAGDFTRLGDLHDVAARNFDRFAGDQRPAFHLAPSGRRDRRARAGLARTGVTLAEKSAGSAAG
jgi:hypothetical protein